MSGKLSGVPMLAIYRGRLLTLAVLLLGVQGVACSAEASKIFVVSTIHGEEVTVYGIDGKQMEPTIPLGETGPSGIAIDEAGKIYVSGGNGITFFSPQGVRITPPGPFRIMPKGPFIGAGLGVAVGANGEIYLLGADKGFAAIRTLSPNGHPTAGTIETGLNNAHGIAVDASGKIYVAAQGSGMIKTFDRAGRPVAPVITTGLKTPRAVAVAPDGKIYVANYLNVTSYLPDGRQAPLTLTHKNPFTEGIASPQVLAVDGTGNIYVGYYALGGGHGMVAIYRPDGTLLAPEILTPMGVTGIAVH